MGYGEDGCERLWMTKTKVLSAQPNATMLVHTHRFRADSSCQEQILQCRLFQFNRLNYNLVCMQCMHCPYHLCF